MEKLVCHFCNEEVCPICTDIYDIPSHCDDCNARFHNCCITNYTINHNIGIPNILRCPSCDVLLKIDEDEIIEVSGEVEVKSVKEFMEKEVLDQIPKQLPEVKPLPKSPSTIVPKESEKLESIPGTKKFEAEDEVIKTIHIGGFFGKAYTVKKIGDKIVYERISKQATFKSNGSNSGKIEDKPKRVSSSRTENNNKKKKQPNFVICQECGTQVNPNKEKKCPNCGFRIL